MITGAATMRITSDEGTDLTIDVEGLRGDADDGYLWDPDRGSGSRGGRPCPQPCPASCCRRGRANGVLAVDGCIVYEPAYDHETPSMPLVLTIEDS